MALQWLSKVVGAFKDAIIMTMDTYSSSMEEHDDVLPLPQPSPTLFQHATRVAAQLPAPPAPGDSPLPLSVPRTTVQGFVLKAVEVANATLFSNTTANTSEVTPDPQHSITLHPTLFTRIPAGVFLALRFLLELSLLATVGYCYERVCAWLKPLPTGIPIDPARLKSEIIVEVLGLKTEVDAAKAEAKAANDRAGSLAARVAALEAEIQNLRQEISNVKSTCNAKTAAVEAGIRFGLDAGPHLIPLPSDLEELWPPASPPPSPVKPASPAPLLSLSSSKYADPSSSRPQSVQARNPSPSTSTAEDASSTSSQPTLRPAALSGSLPETKEAGNPPPLTSTTQNTSLVSGQPTPHPAPTFDELCRNPNVCKFWMGLKRKHKPCTDQTCSLEHPGRLKASLPLQELCDKHAGGCRFGYKCRRIHDNDF